MLNKNVRFMHNLVIIDVETTQNPRTKKEEIIEFAGVEVNDRLEKIREVSYLINPQCPLSLITRKVTGISEHDLQGKPLVGDVLPEILAFLAGKIVIAHNARFDIAALNHACEKCNRILDGQFVDSMKIAKKIFPEDGVSLTSLKQRFGVVIRGHRAKDDVTATVEILSKLAVEYQKKVGRELLHDLLSFLVG